MVDGVRSLCRAAVEMTLGGAGMLVELAVGDAYGAGFEFASHEFVTEHNTLGGYLQHSAHSGIRPGNYTDDTQMTIAIAELLVSGEPWTRQALADKYVEVFHRDVRPGYAGGFYRLLTEVRSGEELLTRLRPHSAKSGAAMRAGPVGLLPTVEEVLHHNEIQARITHDTPSGLESAHAAALAVHYCHHNLGPVQDTAIWVQEQLTADWATPWRAIAGITGEECVRAALTALTTADSLSGILHACVAFEGDTDTVATIALAAASRSAEITQDLPAVLVDNLENSEYGRDYLNRLDEQLLTRFRSGNPSRVR
jgi:ADP-ribosyl-[dinitrogen reductase] hydrolase